MFTSRVEPLMRSERNPLREVQNERPAVQQQKTLTDKTTSLQDTNTEQAENENLNPGCGEKIDHNITSLSPSFRISGEGTDTTMINYPENVTFKSFVCTGGEVELFEASEMWEVSSLVGAMSQGDRPETLNNITVANGEETEIMLTVSDHTDHPYCRSLADGQSVCQTELMRDGKMPDADEVSSAGHAANSDVADFSAVLSFKGGTDITFKSFLCPGGEVEVEGGSTVMQHESIWAEDAQSTEPTESFHYDTESSEGLTECPLSLSRHFDHPYCDNSKKCPIPRVPDAVENISKTFHLQNLSTVDFLSAGHTALSNNADVLPTKDSDITFKSFTCPGGEVEIKDGSIIKDGGSVLAGDGPHGDPLESFTNEIELSEEPTDLPVSPSGIIDHPYCCNANEFPIPSNPGPAENVSNTSQAQNLFISAVGQLSECEDVPLKSLNFSGVKYEIENTLSMRSMSEMSMLVTNLAVDGRFNLFSSGFNGNDRENIENSEALSLEREHADHFYCRVDEVKDGIQCDEPVNPSVPEPIGFRNEDHSRSQCLSSTQLDGTKGVNHAGVGESQSFKSELKNLFVPEGMVAGPELSDQIQDPSQLHCSENKDQEEGNLESRLWPELPDSPLPPPQFNSTALPLTPISASPLKRRDGRVKAVVRPKEKVPALDFSTMGKGPLQQQLRQMAELLMLASGKITVPPTPAPVQHHNAAVGTTPVGRHSAVTWTSPVQLAERSVNTSALVEIVREVEVSDACTSTDPLLWSVSPSSLQCLSRSELEQKMLSTLILVEVLSQQLSAQTRTTGTSPSPSELRDRLVQTEDTQLSQTGPYRELYVSALDRIQTLEEDQQTLKGLHLAIQQMMNTMTSMKTETEEALISLKQVEGIVTEDHEILYKQVGEIKALYARCMGTVRKMTEKCRACLQKRDRMRRSMEDALQEKEMVLRVLEQLRAHHSEQVSNLQNSLGSQQELTAALTHTYPQLMAQNRASAESLLAASALLRDTLQDHDLLAAELCKAQQLLRKTGPVLHRLQQRASAAVEQSQLCQAERDRAVEDRAQMEVELQQVHSSLEEAGQQISDLNTQITIMNSEMAVLREQLVEVEEERVQLQRKSTELSATVSSSLASYAFLEQALASETSKLQRSLHDTQEATERADSLQEALEVSGRRVEELEGALAQRDALLTELHTETENQRLQLRRLTQIQTELTSTKEMSEFLQVENELTREQLTESEGLLRSHLQGLRERNLECEDLRLAIQQLRAEKEALQEELVSTQENARSMLLEQGAQLAQATLDVSLLQHRIRSLTSNTLPASAKSSEAPGQDEQLQPFQKPQSSFVSSVMLALSAEPEDDTAPAETDDPGEGIGSKSSAFTRLATSETHHDDDGIQSMTLVELLASLGDSVLELQSAFEQQNQHKDSELNSLQSNIHGLQEALQKESDRYKKEEVELKQQVSRLKAQVERDAEVLNQKTQDEKALRKLCSELEENMEAVSKYRAENNELRREGAELRRMLQQSQVEVQALRAALTRSGGQSAASTKELDDQIRLLKEVEKLKAKLLEVEESRTKLLERAKRHQMVHTMNQSKLERELHLLDDMIEAVRKALSSVPEVVRNCPELQKLVEFLG